MVLSSYTPPPTRFVVVVMLENEAFQPYCIACHWTGKQYKTRAPANNAGKRHQCPRPKRRN